MNKSKRLSGIYFKERRIALGLSQLEVAMLLGYDSSEIISRWERGLDFPPEEMFKKIPEVFKISEEEWNSILETETVK